MKWIDITPDLKTFKEDIEYFFDGGENPPVWGRFKNNGDHIVVIVLDSSGEEDEYPITDFVRYLDESPSPSLSAEQEVREYAEDKVKAFGKLYMYADKEVEDLIAAAYLAGKASKDVIEKIRQFDLTDIDAPVFTHSKEFENNFKYIKKKLLEIIDKPLPTPPVK